LGHWQPQASNYHGGLLIVMRRSSLGWMCGLAPSPDGGLPPRERIAFIQIVIARASLLINDLSHHEITYRLAPRLSTSRGARSFEVNHDRV